MKQLLPRILPILRQNNVISASIFGSFARGEANEASDLDLLVELPKEATLIEHAGLKLDLEDNLKRKVDVVTKYAISQRLMPYIQHDLIQIL